MALTALAATVFVKNSVRAPFCAHAIAFFNCGALSVPLPGVPLLSATTPQMPTSALPGIAAIQVPPTRAAMAEPPSGVTVLVVYL